MKLDRTREYGEIFGGSGAHRYEQDGRLFDPHGDAIGDEPAAPPVVTDSDKTDLPNGARDFESMHWKSLEALANQYGYEGERNKPAMIAFLRGKPE